METRTIMAILLVTARRLQKVIPPNSDDCRAGGELRRWDAYSKAINFLHLDDPVEQEARHHLIRHRKHDISARKAPTCN